MCGREAVAKSGTSINSRLLLGCDRLSLNATYHYLAVATNMDKSSKTLGHDIDIEASYQVLKDARVSLGFSYMKGSETMEKLKRVEDNNDLKWAWVSLVVSPRLVSKKW